MDIEWAIAQALHDGGNILIFQARPETVWSKKPTDQAKAAVGSAMDYILSGMLAGRRVS